MQFAGPFRHDFDPGASARLVRRRAGLAWEIERLQTVQVPTRALKAAARTLSGSAAGFARGGFVPVPAAEAGIANRNPFSIRACFRRDSMPYILAAALRGAACDSIPAHGNRKAIPRVIIG